jgi:putative transposase
VLLTQAVDAEVSEFLAATGDLSIDDGGRRIVRHGQLPAREIITGIGPSRCASRVRDREASADDPARIRFRPAILPPYARRSRSVDTLIPILYGRVFRTGDFA